MIPPNKQFKCYMPCHCCGNLNLRSKWDLERRKYVFCNTSCQNKWQRANTDFNKGKNNPAYKHGQRIGEKLPNYPEEFNKSLKRQIKIRDGYNCQKCGLNYSGKLGKHLDIHHIDEDKFNNNPINLTTLCKPCHTKTHHQSKMI